MTTTNISDLQKMFSNLKYCAEWLHITQVYQNLRQNGNFSASSDISPRPLLFL